MVMSRHVGRGDPGDGGAEAPGVGGANEECEVCASRGKETLLISILLLLAVEVASAIHKVVYL